MKVCRVCNLSLEDSMFRKGRVCRECEREKNREYIRTHKKEKVMMDKLYRENNKEKIKENKKRYYETNKDLIREKQKQYYIENSKHIKNKVKEYRDNNIDKVKERKKIYYENNKDYLRKWHSIYEKNRRKKDPMFKLICATRHLIWGAIRDRAGFEKTKSTEEILGCNIEDFKLYIEEKFKDSMNWENYGEWHIDHIIPISSAKTEAEVVKLNHYTNLQPLWAEENIKKGNKIIT